MKTVTILYFAAVRDLAGAPSEKLRLPDRVQTVEQLLNYLGDQKATLKHALGSVRVARNEIFAALDEPIETGDVLALIPPVQGG